MLSTKQKRNHHLAADFSMADMRILAGCTNVSLANAFRPLFCRHNFNRSQNLITGGNGFKVFSSVLFCSCPAATGNAGWLPGYNYPGTWWKSGKALTTLAKEQENNLFKLSFNFNSFFGFFLLTSADEAATIIAM